MMNLAVKYRPERFADVVCQDNVKKVLTNQLETNEVKQAYLFCGSSGTGKTTHMLLWQKMLGDRFKFINGDKPIIRFIDNVPYIVDCIKTIDKYFQ